ncbi:MAG: S-layer homology domain-containing protein [Oscillospiraceae bacterium]
MVTMRGALAGSTAARAKPVSPMFRVDSYYAQAVAWAVENGITTGVGGGEFDPNATYNDTDRHI